MGLPDPLPARPAPLRVDSDGSVRIGASRVTLDALVGAFRAGATAEEIVMKFPSLDLTGDLDRVDTAIAEAASRLGAKLSKR